MLPVIAEIVRSGFVEGHHYGSVLALDADRSVAFERGDTTSTVLPRSCNKPLQAVGMLRAGLELDGELLALACASHSGEDFHLDGVRRILAGAGLDESALQNPPGWPLDDATRDRLLREGGTQTRLHMNCSGKHAAMLATCVANGWPLETYLSPEHPLQQAIAAAFAELTGEPVGASRSTGAALPCSAPRCADSPGRSRWWRPARRQRSVRWQRRSGSTRSTSPARPATSSRSFVPSRARSRRPVPSPATSWPCRTVGPSP
jgi:L-asparaginase II